MNLRLPAGALLVACIAFAACGVLDPHACTEIGCSSGLRVVVVGAPTSGATVTIREPGQNPVLLTCTSTDACALGVMLMGRTPATVTIEVSSTRGQTSTTASPTYADWQPNGEDCPPVCHQATVSVAA